MTFDPHKPCRTRDGREAVYLGRTGSPEYPHRFRAGPDTITVNDDGKWHVLTGQNASDLFNIPEPRPPAFDPHKPVQTRDGRAVRILCTDRKGTGAAADYPIIALVDLGSQGRFENPQAFTAEGRQWKYPPHGDKGAGDLINTPEEHTRWLVVTKDADGRQYVIPYSTEHNAKTACSTIHKHAIACIPVTYREGDGLP